MRRGRFLYGASAALIAAPASVVLAADAYTMRLSVSSPITDSSAIAAVRFATAVARRSNGQVKIDVYPSGQLATQAGTVDGLVIGSVDFSIMATTNATTLVPQYQVLDAPFLFKNFGVANRVLRGKIGDELFGLLDAKGILGLGWGNSGFREIETVSKAIVTPDDMKGLRIRVPGGVYPAMFQALGAIPVFIDIAEAFVALTQHTVDGIDLNIAPFVAQKMYTQVKHIAVSNHVLSVTAIMGSKRKIEALPVALQRIIKEAARASAPSMQELASSQETDGISLLKQNGVTFTEIQYPAFRKAMEPVYEGIQSRVGGTLLERITKATATA